MKFMKCRMTVDVNFPHCFLYKLFKDKFVKTIKEWFENGNIIERFLHFLISCPVRI